MVNELTKNSIKPKCIKIDVDEKVARKSACTWTAAKANETPGESPHVRMPPILTRSAGKIQSSILESIGCTPVVRLDNFARRYSIKCELLVKCEFLNPGGSVKDRIALRMVQEAERAGQLVPNAGHTIIEPTSGNTGIGLAMVAALRGYKCIIVMPEKMSSEKHAVLAALGATIVRTPTEAKYNEPNSHITRSYQLQAEIPNSVVLNQYSAAGNGLAHYDGTAEEIIEACDGHLDALVLGAGTGGTATGIGRKLREKMPNTKLIVADPVGSILADANLILDVKKTNNGKQTNERTDGFYEVEGIGYDFIPTVLDRSIVDYWMKTNDKESFELARMLIKTEALLVGGSSGSALAAALRAIDQLGYKDDPSKKVMVVLPDGVRNYMTKFMDDEWLKKRIEK